MKLKAVRILKAASEMCLWGSILAMTAMGFFANIALGTGFCDSAEIGIRSSWAPGVSFAIAYVLSVLLERRAIRRLKKGHAHAR